MSTSAPVVVPPPLLAVPVLPLLLVVLTPPPRRPRRRVSHSFILIATDNALLTCFSLLQRRRSPTRTWASVSSTKESNLPRRLFSYFFVLPLHGFRVYSHIDRSYRMEEARYILRAWTK